MGAQIDSSRDTKPVGVAKRFTVDGSVLETAYSLLLK